MRITNRDHGCQDVVPGILLGHNLVGKHAAVPTNVREFFRELSVAQPAASLFGDIELAVGILGQAMAAGLIMTSRAVHGGIVLCNMKVKGPGAQRIGHLAIGSVECRPIGPVEIFWQQAIFRRVHAEQVQKRVCHVGLKA